MQLSLVLATLALTSVSIFAMQEKPKRFAYPEPDDMNAGMARWMATFKAGQPHERLKEALGEWDATMRMGMPGATGKPMESKGSAKATWFVEG
ncbi:MAG: hypothetical protein IT453_03205, partial [Planctomycetes bacterium]|nr:hypothetical protein [Planctomycetota bacterium]